MTALCDVMQVTVCMTSDPQDEARTGPHTSVNIRATFIEFAVILSTAAANTDFLSFYITYIYILHDRVVYILRDIGNM